MFSFCLKLFVIFNAFNTIDAIKHKQIIKKAPVITPIGDCQKEYCALLSNPDVSILAGLGPAGCGKTYFACHAAVNQLVAGNIDRVVITRPLVAVDEELGFLPGSISQKMDPWVRPVMDILGEFYSKTEIRRMMDEGVVEIAPLAYMRGRTFRRAFLIADEMQNSTPNQMLMMLTRIGEGSKLVITGDLMQSDLKGGMNGLEDFYGRLKKGGNVELVKSVEFGIGDVQRSPVVASILALYGSKISNGFKDAALIPKGDYKPL